MMGPLGLGALFASQAESAFSFRLTSLERYFIYYFVVKDFCHGSSITRRVTQS
jgi:hypothetical protein